jgi:hypothetical protein
VAELSTRPWVSISESNCRDAGQFCAACLIDLNPSGEEKTRALCRLPVREPGGACHRNGIRAAAAALAGAGRRSGDQLRPLEALTRRVARPSRSEGVAGLRRLDTTRAPANAVVAVWLLLR